jgi:hypothetical protein
METGSIAERKHVMPVTVLTHDTVRIFEETLTRLPRQFREIVKGNFPSKTICHRAP